jgi:membrane-associated phospholipid phosphatase
LFFWGMWRKPWQRAVLVAYPLAMVFALVYGGEHYVVDALIGWAYAFAVHFGCLAWEGRQRVAPAAAAGVS